MGQEAENLLDDLLEVDPSARLYDPSIEEHIVIGEDRFITVPPMLKKIAVQFDHNIETVTFDCPRYWDGHDMSTMKVYINYLTPNNGRGMYPADNVVVDDENDKIMHFEWTLSREVTTYKGNISFLVCIKAIDEDGMETNHWNSELNREMVISEGLECGESIVQEYPDLITQILLRLDRIGVELTFEDDGKGNVDIVGISNLNNFAPKFDKECEYPTGSYCMYLGTLYKSICDINPGEWDSTKWIDVYVTGELTEINNYIRNTNTNVQRVDRYKVSLPVDENGNKLYGAAGQFAVSDGKGGITWVTIVDGDGVKW